MNSLSGNQSCIGALAVLYRQMSSLNLVWLNNVDCIVELTG